MRRLIHVVGSLALFACACAEAPPGSMPKASPGAKTVPSSRAFALTMFSASSFSCSTETTYPATGLVVAVTEDSPLLGKEQAFTCLDRWLVLDLEHPPWGRDPFFVGKTAEGLAEIFRRVPESYRERDGHWEYNEPDCTTPMRERHICALPIQIKAHTYRAETEGVDLPLPDAPVVTAYIYDACPSRHWNNSIKDLGDHPDNRAGGNPCRLGAASLDLKDTLWSQLHLPPQVASAKAVAARLPAPEAYAD